MMPLDVKDRFLDISAGQRFGKLVAYKPAGFERTAHGYLKSLWEFQCDCGAATVMHAYLVIKGKNKSCGCAGISKWDDIDEALLMMEVASDFCKRAI